MKKVTLQLIALILAGALAVSMLGLAVAPLFITHHGEIIDDAGDPDFDGNAPENDTGGDANSPDTGSDNESEALPDPAPEPPKEETDSGSLYIRSLTNGLTIRSGAGTGFSSLGHINKGDMLHYVGRTGNWYETLYKNKKAYISANTSYTELYKMEHANSGDSAVEAVINEGLNLLGFVYVYGAVRLHDGKGNLLKNFDPTEYDCSSLMQYIFYHGADINLNMTTRTQVSQGSHVPKNRIARGDLIFFTNSARYNKTGVERIGHVALYLGDNYILHTASDYAVIEPISNTRWSYYIETRRVF